jgi:hypothetical protein
MSTITERLQTRKLHLLTIEDRIRARVAELRKEADEIKVHAEREIAGRLTAAYELERLLSPPPTE